MKGREVLREFREELKRVIPPLPIDTDEGLTRLALTLIDLIRRLLERQALIRVEAGSLSPEEMERLGLAFMNLKGDLEELRALLGIDGEELKLEKGKEVAKIKPPKLRLPLPPRPGRPQGTKKGKKGYDRRREKRVPPEEQAG